MTRKGLAIAAVGLAACSGSPSVPTTGVPTVIEDGAAFYTLTWAPDDGALVEVGVPALAGPMTMTGPDCDPAVAVALGASNGPETSAGLFLYFDGPPVAGMTAALPGAEQPSGWLTTPLVLITYYPYLSIGFGGGEVRIVQFDDAGWVFRFEGLGFEVCDDGCVPHPGGTVNIEPVNPNDSMPAAEDECIPGAPFTWPDGREACAAQSFGRTADCPDPMPW